MKKIVLPLFVLVGISAHVFAQQADSNKDILLVTAKGDTLKSPDTLRTFMKVDVEAEFPGGQSAWYKFIKAKLRYPKEAVAQNIQGMVVLKFIVCADGTVCNVEAISGPEQLRMAALAFMRNTPNWTPAFINGQKIRAYKTQPIIFKLPG